MRFRPACARDPQLLCRRHDQRISLHRYARRIRTYLGCVAAMAARRAGPESLVDGGRSVGHLRQYRNLDRAG
jgi:hypothetical protein